MFEAGLRVRRQQVGQVGHPRAQRRDGKLGVCGDRQQRQCKEEDACVRPARDRSAAQSHSNQNCTSGGVSAPARASKVGRTSAPSRKRAVRLVGKNRTSLLYSATASM